MTTKNVIQKQFRLTASAHCKSTPISRSPLILATSSEVHWTPPKDDTDIALYTVDDIINNDGQLKCSVCDWMDQSQPGLAKQMSSHVDDYSTRLYNRAAIGDGEAIGNDYTTLVVTSVAKVSAIAIVLGVCISEINNIDKRFHPLVWKHVHGLTERLNYLNSAFWGDRNTAITDLLRMDEFLVTVMNLSRRLVDLAELCKNGLADEVVIDDSVNIMLLPKNKTPAEAKKDSLTFKIWKFFQLLFTR